MEDEIRGLLPLYYDGELSGEAARRVELHLAGCAACRAELAELRELSLMLQGAGETVTAGEADALWQAVQPRLGEQRAPVPWRTWLPGLILLTLYGVFGLLLAAAPLLRLAGIGFELPLLLLPGSPLPLIGVSPSMVLAFCLFGSAGVFYLVWLGFWWSRHAAGPAHSSQG
jgi:anti-sigma factor RsiW